MPVASCIYLMNAPTKWEHEELKLFGYVNIFDNLWSCLVLFRKRIMEFFTLVYCFVQHSVVAPNCDSEGTPVAILEAQAAGLPVMLAFQT